MMDVWGAAANSRCFAHQEIVIKFNIKLAQGAEIRTQEIVCGCNLFIMPAEDPN